MTDIENLIKENTGIRLDIGCGGNKQEGFVGLDIRPLPGVDIVHNVTKFPWPLPDECVTLAVASHLVEHIPPFAPDPRLTGLIEFLLYKNIIKPHEVAEHIGDYSSTPQFIGFMNEVWRVMKPGGQFAIAVPHGYSMGYLQDPTHCNPCNEATWSYFTPEHPLWGIYKPKPWKINQDNLSWSPTTNIEVVMIKIKAVEDE